MAIPTTANFDLDVVQLIEAAHTRCGGAQSTAYELSSARRALNLVFQKITNRGVNLWQLELATLSLVKGQTDYLLPADTVDIWRDVVIRDTAATEPNDYPVARIGYDEYLYTNDKSTPGLPTQFMIERGLAQPKLRVYPSPELTTYQLRYWRIKKPRDAATYLDQVDYPARWQGPLIAGLAYYLSLDRADTVTPERRAELKAQWEEEYREAAEEYQDRSDLVIDADLSVYSRIN